MKTVKRPPAAQVAFANKASAMKADSTYKVLEGEDEVALPPHDRKRVHAPGKPWVQGVCLLDKAEVLAIANVSFPTIWAWMRAGTFPRSRIVGGKSMWLSTDIDAWLTALPLRPLKGDETTEAA